MIIKKITFFTFVTHISLLKLPPFRKLLLCLADSHSSEMADQVCWGRLQCLPGKTHHFPLTLKQARHTGTPLHLSWHYIFSLTFLTYGPTS